MCISSGRCKSGNEITEFFYLPTDAQENCFKKNFKIYIKTAPTCFGAITIIIIFGVYVFHCSE
jgi:hypothetical protein